MKLPVQNNPVDRKGGPTSKSNVGILLSGCSGVSIPVPWGGNICIGHNS